ncbi:hypothetical protein HZH68_006517 [Vespula germanica]|uniref:Uncharacterized protein n=1 Tax=Vespula germanica TaxID=30212 RepID=A0A834KBN3_VESGE|nr:hypothetical protein HZH68_006517 [Vespula germanica]
MEAQRVRIKFYFQLNQCLFKSTHPTKSTAENDAVQALLARYLQKRLQGTQLSTLPPPAVLFNSRHQAKVRQAAQKGSTTNSGGLTRNSHPSSNYKDNRKHREDYEDDYVDDLQGFEDSDRSRTRIDLLAGKKERELDETRLIDSP